MDLQKVLLLPTIYGSKDTIFTSRLVFFNQTFAPIAKNEQPVYCYLWHEGIQGRGADDMTSAIMNFIKDRRKEEIVIWADNCTGQNKNWWLYTALVQLVNDSDDVTNKVTIKYLTKGHTHMAADSVHGCIEQKIKRTQNVYDYDHLCEVIETSRKNVKIWRLSSTDFRAYKNEKRPGTGNIVNAAVSESCSKRGKSVSRYKTALQVLLMKLTF